MNGKVRNRMESNVRGSDGRPIVLWKREDE